MRSASVGKYLHILQLGSDFSSQNFSHPTGPGLHKLAKIESWIFLEIQTQTDGNFVIRIKGNSGLPVPWGLILPWLYITGLFWGIINICEMV